MVPEREQPTVKACFGSGLLGNPCLSGGDAISGDMYGSPPSVKILEKCEKIKNKNNKGVGRHRKVTCSDVSAVRPSQSLDKYVPE